MAWPVVSAMRRWRRTRPVSARARPRVQSTLGAEQRIQRLKLARKLAVVLHRMLADGRSFMASKVASSAAGAA
jgi:hypothetical protein